MLETHLLQVTVGGNGTGTVTSNPVGIECGQDCIEIYDYGTRVTLTANPAQGSIFTGWTGGGCNGTGSCVVRITQATNVSATFGVSSGWTFPLGSG